MALLALPRLDFSVLTSTINFNWRLVIGEGLLRSHLVSSCIIIIILSVSGETNEMGKLDAMRATLEDSVASRFTTAPLTFLDF